MKASALKRLLLKAVPEHLPVLLVGQPGIGKTDIVTAAAAELGADLIVEHPVVSDPTDYKGLPFPTADGAEFLPFGMLKQLISADRLTSR
jgi:midasin (ATPase involved in ribosome maturation)